LLETPIEEIAVLGVRNTDASVPSMMDGDDVTVIGFGSLSEEEFDPSRTLQSVVLQVSDFETCNESYLGQLDSDEQLCAGVEEGGKDACFGDAGGPLMVAGDLIVGLVSGGNGCGQPEFPGFYSRVSYYNDFIDDSICRLSSDKPSDCAPVTEAPVVTPTLIPVVAPSVAPVIAPVAAPSVAPVAAPVVAPVVAPVIAPVAPSRFHPQEPTREKTGGKQKKDKKQKDGDDDDDSSSKKSDKKSGKKSSKKSGKKSGKKSNSGSSKGSGKGSSKESDTPKKKKTDDASKKTEKETKKKDAESKNKREKKGDDGPDYRRTIRGL